MNDSHKNSESKLKTRKPELVALRERQRNRNRAVAALGALVVLATVMALMVPAISMTHGDLICGMEEHQHSDACYEKALTCTQEEGEGHVHSDACYESKLICGKDAHTHNDTCYAAPEPEPAAGTNRAADQQSGSDAGTTNQQSNDQPNVLKNDDGTGQQPDSQPGVLANDGTGTDGAAASQGTTATDVSATPELPAQTFEANLVEKDGDKEKTVLTVSVDAPEGALPPNTAMKIKGVDADKVAGDLKAAISYDANLKGKAQPSRSIAVNVSFADADGNEVEPAEDVKVKIWSSYVPEFSASEAELEGQGSADADAAAPTAARHEKPVLIHVLDAKRAKKDGKLDSDGKPMKAEVMNGAVLANWDDEDKTKDHEDTFKFNEDEFGTFVITELMTAGAEDADGQPQAGEGDAAGADGKTLVTMDDPPAKHLSDKLVDGKGNITLTVGVDVPDGALPEGATMQLTPVTKESTLEAAKDAAAAQTDIVASRAQVVAVDITFFDKDGAMVEPKADVHVTMSAPAAAKDAAAQDDLAVVHLPEGEAAEVVSTTSADPATATAEFDSADFSVYALVCGTQIKTTVISAKGDTYEVTVTYGQDARIPDSAELRVREISPEAEEYKALQQKAGEKLADEINSTIPSHPILLDISFVDGDTVIEPAEGSSVSVEMKLLKDSVTGLYSSEDSPILVNNKPFKADEQRLSQELKIIHDMNDEELDIVDLREEADDENLIGNFDTESFSNWLIYLDEDLEEITINQGDSITLRPYSEWVWDQKETVDGQTVKWKTVTVNNQQTINTNGIMTVTPNYNYHDDQLDQTYDSYTLTTNGRTGTFNLERENGEIIKVTVTSNYASDKPSVIPFENTVQGLTVNMFNYDADGSLDVRQNVASYIDSNNGTWSTYGSNDPNDWSTITSNSPGPYANDGINAGSALKFLGWGASNGSNRINNYDATHVTTGIVQNTLATGTGENKYPQLNGNGNTSLEYLFSSGNSDVAATYNVPGLFQQDEDGYYYFNSNSNYAYLDDGQFKLYEHTYSQRTGNGITSKPIGFFPYHDFDSSNNLSPNHDHALDHHFGMSMEVKFVLPEGKVLHKAGGVTEPISFEFSGDDDMWVFISDDSTGTDTLALDMGGIHQPLTGSIDFTNDSRFVAGKEYTLRVFYVERGGCDSNCSIRFNIPLTKRPFTFEKQDAQDKTKFLKGAKFGLFKDPECKIPAVDDMSGNEYTATADDNGVVSFNVSIGNYYMKELEAPAGYRLDETVRRVVLTENGVTIQGDQDSNRDGVQIANQKNPDLTVEKEWQNQDGTVITAPEGASATFQLKRYVSYEGYQVVPNTTQPCTFRVYRSKSGQTPKQEGADYTFEGGTQVRVDWGYDNGYLEYSNTRKRHYGDSSSNDQSQVKPADGPAVITLPTSGAAAIYIHDEDLGSQYDPGVKDITVNGTPYTSGNTTEYVSADWAEDGDYEGPELTLPTDKIDDEHPWKGKFSNLTVTEIKNGVTYRYKYYIVEKAKTPSDSDVVYVDGSGAVVSDPATLRTDESGSQKVINKVPNGKLQLQKVVKYNNEAPPADKKALFEGDYTFTVCKDEHGLEPYPNSENPITFTVHIGRDAEPAFSEVKDLPAGDYWIRENVGEDAQILPVGSNPKRVTVAPSSDGSATQAQIHTETNNLLVNENDDNLTLDIEKTFSGIGATEIPDDFKIVVTYELDGTEHTIELKCENSHTTVDGLKVSITHPNDDPLSWKWHVYGIDEDSTNFRVKEVNYTKPGYALCAFYNGEEIVAPDEPIDEQTVPLTAEAAVITRVDGRTTSQTNMENYILADDYVVLIAIPGNVHGTVVVSKRSLNMAERDAIAQGIPSIQGPFTNDHMWFYSEEEHFIEGQDVPITPTGNRTFYFKTVGGEHIIECPPSSNKQAFAYSVSYGGKTSITNAAYTNVYTEIGIDLNVVKVEKDSDRELPGATFKATLLDEQQTTAGRIVPKTPGFSNEYGPTDQNGEVSLTGLKTGYYMIEESQAPAGYIMSAEDSTFYIRVNAGEITYLVRSKEAAHAEDTLDKWDSTKTSSGLVTYDAETRTATVENVPGAALPNTGGPGTKPFMILGAILIAGAGLLLWRKRIAI